VHRSNNNVRRPCEVCHGQLPVWREGRSRSQGLSRLVPYFSWYLVQNNSQLANEAVVGAGKEGDIGSSRRSRGEAVVGDQEEVYYVASVASSQVGRRLLQQMPRLYYQNKHV